MLKSRLICPRKLALPLSHLLSQNCFHSSSLLPGRLLPLFSCLMFSHIFHVFHKHGSAPVMIHVSDLRVDEWHSDKPEEMASFAQKIIHNIPPSRLSQNYESHSVSHSLLLGPFQRLSSSQLSPQTWRACHS